MASTVLGEPRWLEGRSPPSHDDLAEMATLSGRGDQLRIFETTRADLADARDGDALQGLRKAAEDVTARFAKTTPWTVRLEVHEGVEQAIRAALSRPHVGPDDVVDLPGGAQPTASKAVEILPKMARGADRDQAVAEWLYDWRVGADEFGAVEL